MESDMDDQLPTLVLRKWVTSSGPPWMVALLKPATAPAPIHDPLVPAPVSGVTTSPASSPTIVQAPLPPPPVALVEPLPSPLAAILSTSDSSSVSPRSMSSPSPSSVVLSTPSSPTPTSSSMSHPVAHVSSSYEPTTPPPPPSPPAPAPIVVTSPTSSPGIGIASAMSAVTSWFGSSSSSSAPGPLALAPPPQPLAPSSASSSSSSWWSLWSSPSIDTAPEGTPNHPTGWMKSVSSTLSWVGDSMYSIVFSSPARSRPTMAPPRTHDAWDRNKWLLFIVGMVVCFVIMVWLIRSRKRKRTSSSLIDELEDEERQEKQKGKRDSTTSWKSCCRRKSKSHSKKNKNKNKQEEDDEDDDIEGDLEGEGEDDDEGGGEKGDDDPSENDMTERKNKSLTKRKDDMKSSRAPGKGSRTRHGKEDPKAKEGTRPHSSPSKDQGKSTTATPGPTLTTPASATATTAAAVASETQKTTKKARQTGDDEKDDDDDDSSNDDDGSDNSDPKASQFRKRSRQGLVEKRKEVRLRYRRAAALAESLPTLDVDTFTAKEVTAVDRMSILEPPRQPTDAVNLQALEKYMEAIHRRTRITQYTTSGTIQIQQSENHVILSPRGEAGENPEEEKQKEEEDDDEDAAQVLHMILPDPPPVASVKPILKSTGPHVASDEPGDRKRQSSSTEESDPLPAPDSLTAVDCYPLDIVNASRRHVFLHSLSVKNAVEVMLAPHQRVLFRWNGQTWLPWGQFSS